MNEKLSSYVWKDKRLTSNKEEKQVEYRLIDMEQEQLQKAYNHCKEMLYNNDNAFQGRTVILEHIKDQMQSCGAELALRWFKTLTDKDGNLLYDNINLLYELKTWLSALGITELADKTPLGKFIQVPPEFKTIPVSYIVDACKDNLGKFDHSKITISFILGLGIWFTPEELDELDSQSEDKSFDAKKKIVKLWNRLEDSTDIHFNPKGLSLAQFTDMIHLKRSKKTKYSELPTSQLNTLRMKVLPLFEDKISSQYYGWRTIMKHIAEVAEYKGYQLT